MHLLQKRRPKTTQRPTPFYFCATAICKNPLDLLIRKADFSANQRRPKTTQRPTPFYFCATVICKKSNNLFLIRISQTYTLKRLEHKRSPPSADPKQHNTPQPSISAQQLKGKMYSRNRNPNRLSYRAQTQNNETPHNHPYLRNSNLQKSP